MARRSSRSGPGSRFAAHLDLDLQMRSGPPASWTWTGPVRFGPGSDPVQAVLTRTLDSVPGRTSGNCRAICDETLPVSVRPAHANLRLIFNHRILTRQGVKRLVVFLHTHSNPDSGDLHCAEGAGLDVCEVRKLSQNSHSLTD